MGKAAQSCAHLKILEPVDCAVRASTQATITATEVKDQADKKKKTPKQDK
jgi:hypothetical protein